MATSGSFTTTGGYAGRNLHFSWSQVSQSIDNNSTIISWTLQGVGGDTSIYYKAGNFKVVIDGATVYSSATRIKLTAGGTVASGQTTIVHNADGSKSFTVSVEAGIYVTNVNSTGSSTFTLNTIPRASQPSCVTWPEHTNEVGYFGDTISIHMNRASSSFTHTVRYEYGNLTGVIESNVGTGCTWTIPLSFMDLIPNATSGQGRIYVDTYSGSTFVGTKYCGFIARIRDNVKPSCEITRIEDTTGYFSTYGAYVQGRSKLQIDVTSTPAYSSPITSYNVLVGGRRYTSRSFVTDVLDISGTNTISAYVTDARGRTSDIVADVTETTITVLPYTRPSVTKLAVSRCNQDGTFNKEGDHAKVTFSASVAPLNQLNGGQFKIGYKKSTDPEYSYPPDATVNFVSPGTVSESVHINIDQLEPVTVPEELWYGLGYVVPLRYDGSITSVISVMDDNTGGNSYTWALFNGRLYISQYDYYDSEFTMDVTYVTGIDAGYELTDYTYIFEAEKTSTYEVELTISDNFGGSLPRTALIPTTFTLLNWGANGTSMGVGKAAEGDHSLEIALNTEFSGNVFGKSFGLGSLPLIPNNDDFDMYTSVGCFSVRNDVTAGTISNMPRQTGGRLIVSACTGYEEESNVQGYREQLFLPHDMFYGTTGWIRMAKWVQTDGVWKWTFGSWNSTALQAYPINSIYISYSHTSPGQLFGGKWERISNYFLWGTSAGGAIGHTGGFETVTLTVDQMPSHSHAMSYGTNTERAGWQVTAMASNSYTTSSVINATGGGQAHTNMPPYIQVSIWRRTA